MENSTSHPSGQTILGEFSAPLGLAKYDAAIRAVLDESSKPLGRKKLAEELALATGRPISIYMVNAWMAPGREFARFPALYIDAFCEVTGNDDLKRLILGPGLSELLQLGERAASVLGGRLRRRGSQGVQPRRRGKAAARKGNRSCAA